MEILDRLQAFKPTRGVYGNVDGAGVRAAVTGDLEWDCEGLRVYMTHIGGYPGNYDARARKELMRRRPGLFICGHSHILKVMRDQALGLVHLNPGRAGIMAGTRCGRCCGSAWTRARFQALRRLSWGRAGGLSRVPERFDPPMSRLQAAP